MRLSAFLATVGSSWGHRVLVRDLGSTNGTFLDGRKLTLFPRLSADPHLARMRP